MTTYPSTVRVLTSTLLLSNMNLSATPDLTLGMDIVLSAARVYRAGGMVSGVSDDERPNRAQARIALRRQIAQRWLQDHAMPSSRRAVEIVVAQDERWQQALAVMQVCLPAIDAMPDARWRWILTQDASPEPDQRVLYHFRGGGLFAGIYMGQTVQPQPTGSTAPMSLAAVRAMLLGGGEKTFTSVFGDEARDVVSAWMPMPGFEA